MQFGVMKMLLTGLNERQTLGNLINTVAQATEGWNGVFGG